MRRWLTETLVLLLGAATALVGAIVALPTLSPLPWHERAQALVAGLPHIATERTYLMQTSVLDAIVSGAARSCAVLALALALVVAVAAPLGYATARPRSRPGIRLLVAGIERLSSAPVLVWAAVAFLVAARGFGLAPREDTNAVAAVLASVLVLAFGDHLLADAIERIRSGIREHREEPYARTIRAAALGERRHLVRALVPALSGLLAARGVLLVSSAIVTEHIFAIRGLGYIVTGAADRSDQEGPLLFAASLSLVAIAIGFRLVHHVAVAIADPRAAA
jgi:peptide/nickel transport system permease protein